MGISILIEYKEYIALLLNIGVAIFYLMKLKDHLLEIKYLFSFLIIFVLTYLLYIRFNNLEFIPTLSRDNIFHYLIYFIGAISVAIIVSSVFYFQIKSTGREYVYIAILFFVFLSYITYFYYQDLQNNIFYYFMYSLVYAPVIEECLFRATFFYFIFEWTKNVVVSVVLISVIFALFHFSGYVAPVIIIFAKSMIVSVIYRYWGIIPAIILHSLNNFIFTCVIYTLAGASGK